MEFIQKFLRLNTMCGESIPDLPLDSFSYKIKHKYPKRLVTYDAEERNEPRVIRRSDLTPSKLDLMQRRLTKKMSREWKGKLDKNEMENVEQYGKALHEMSVERLKAGIEQVDENNSIEWDGLDPVKKFRFYWQALTGHKLRATPYANFKHIFMRLYHDWRPDECDRRLRMLARRSWLCLTKKERVTFNLQALLYHISTGDVDPYDHCAIRVLLNRWR